MKASSTWKGLRVSMVAVSALTMIACFGQPYPRAEHMVPQLAQTLGPKVASKTLRVVGPTKGENPSVNPVSVGPGTGEPSPSARITLPVFGEALRNTLTQSGLFKSVTSEGKADYELSVPLFSQQMFLRSMFPVWHFTARIETRYKLVETASGKEIWKGASVSQCDSDFQTPANECAMRKNLSELVDHLSRLPLE